MLNQKFFLSVLLASVFFVAPCQAGCFVLDVVVNMNCPHGTPTQTCSPFPCTPVFVGDSRGGGVMQIVFFCFNCPQNEGRPAFANPVGARPWVDTLHGPGEGNTGIVASLVGKTCNEIRGCGVNLRCLQLPGVNPVCSSIGNWGPVGAPFFHIVAQLMSIPCP